jgi:hypothetical protein
MRTFICLQIPTTFLKRLKNHFSQLFNVHSASDVRQTEIHIAEPQLLDPSPLEVETAIPS